MKSSKFYSAESGSNSLAGMKAQLVKLSQVKSIGKVSATGGHRIPNVARYEVMTKEYNAILSKIGINLRLPTESVRDLLDKDDSMNKYMEYQIKKIRKYIEQGDMKQAGYLCKYNLKNSVAFRLSAIHHVVPQGYFSMSTNEFFALHRKVNAIIHSNNDQLDYTRVYIDKTRPDGSKTYRPLGVPTLEGRIVLHMYVNFLHIMLEKHLLPTQHGFIPGRGTLSAGREILTKARHAKYIYECDLKQFFPSVDIVNVSNTLRDLKFPEELVVFLENVNRRAPKLPEELLLDEGAYVDREQVSSALKAGEHVNPESSIFDTLKEIYGPNPELLKQHMIEDGCESVEEGVQLQGALFDSFKPTSIGNLFKGVPQGAPTSPLLAIVTKEFKEFLSGQVDINGDPVESISYADDPTFFANEDFKIKDNEGAGIIIHEEKSGGVKRDGKGIKPWKYLGLVLHNGEYLISDTKTGVRELIPISLQELLKKVADINPGSPDQDLLEGLAKRNLMGGIQACMFTRNGTNEQAEFYRGKGILATMGKVHKKAGLTRFPKNTDSSKAFKSIANIIGKMNKQASKKYFKANV